MLEALALFLPLGIFVLIGAGSVVVRAAVWITSLVDWWRSLPPSSRETPFGRLRCQSDPPHGWWKLGPFPQRTE